MVGGVSRKGVVKSGGVKLVKTTEKPNRQQFKPGSKYQERSWQSKRYKGRRRFRRLLKNVLPLEKQPPIDPRLLFKHRRVIRQELNRDVRRAVGFQRVLERRALRRRTRKVSTYRHFRQRNRSMVVKSVRIIKKVDYFWRRVVLLPYARRLPFQLENLPYTLTRFQRKPFYGLFEQRMQFRGLFGLPLQDLWRTTRDLYGSSHLGAIFFRFFRLDMLLLWLGYATTIFESRRLICSGVVIVNGRICTRASYMVSPYDIWSLASGFRRQFRKLLIARLNRLRIDNIQLSRWPFWFEFNIRLVAFTYVPSLYNYDSFKLPFAFNMSTVGRTGKHKF